MRKEVYWPRVIKYNEDAEVDSLQKQRQEIKDKIKAFLLEVKEKEMREMLENVYLNNFIHAKDAKQMELLFNILKAMLAIDRKYFVLKESRHMAYFDSALPIGYGQTISQPSTVARMLMLLLDGIWEKQKEKNEKINAYEIGAGSGWNAALLAFVLSNYVKKFSVVSVDRIKGLTDLANQNLKDLKRSYEKSKGKTKEKVLAALKNLRIDFGDGFEYAKGKKFDYIIFTAGIPNAEIEKKVREMAEKNLKAGGRLICPETYGQIFIYEKEEEKLRIRKTQEEYVFVPLLEGKIFE